MMNIRFVTLVPENLERLASDQGTMLDLCLSVEGTESCGSIDEEGRAPEDWRWPVKTVTTTANPDTERVRCAF